MTKGKSKNNPANKKETQKVNLKLSNDCELCMQCEKGRKYVENIHNGKSGKGVVCYK